MPEVTEWSIATSEALWNAIAPMLGVADRDYVTKLILTIDFNGISRVQIEELCRLDDGGSITAKSQLFSISPIQDAVVESTDQTPVGDIAVSSTSPWVLSDKGIESARLDE